ncbi:hypothetical protein CHS0354_030941 [Potamilus streckersoni]|uniref:Fibronectin type-III domain-containing protein n=1 Tax=Potamilus streckersoni TaxID=2493646 RepID=A0AAE0RYQ5_9BIVA|nr:hypothetical protein CHS0354_030941 [Potamilus streckersoni]
MVLVLPVMDTSQAPTDDILQTLDISDFTSSSITLEWRLGGKSATAVNGFQVHYQKASSTYIQYGPMLTATATKYIVRNLVADTYYKVCLVTYRNATSPIRECVDASTSNWHLPVSIESSIGAVLALSFIVIIVLLTRCRLPIKLKRKLKKETDQYETISANYPDDQYDFSDTTQGHEDDLVSNQDESAVLGETKQHSKGRRSTCERLCNGNPNPGFSNSYGQNRKSSSPAVFITEEDIHYHESKDRKSHRKSSNFAQDKQHHQLYHHISLPPLPLQESGKTTQRGHWKYSPTQILLYKFKSERAKQALQYEAPTVYPLNDPVANHNTNQKGGDEIYLTDKLEDIIFIDDSPPLSKGQTLEFHTGERSNKTNRKINFLRETTLDDNFETCDGAVGGVPENNRLDPLTEVQYWHEMRAVEMGVRDGIGSLPDMNKTDEHVV